MFETKQTANPNEKPPYAPPAREQPMKSIPTQSDKDFRCPDCDGSGIIKKTPGNITGKFGMVENSGIRDSLPEATIINPFGGFEEINQLCPKCGGVGNK